jgi:gliding motility-associated-like protein
MNGSFFLLIVVFSCVYTPICAQEIDDHLLWAKTSDFPEYSGASVNQSDLDADRNLYVIGTHFEKFPWVEDPTQTISMQQIFICKYDTDGNMIWSKEFGNDKYYSYGGDIRIDKQGDIVFTGLVNDLAGTIFGQPVQGFFLAKMDPDGNLKWITPISKTNLWTWGERNGSFGKQNKLEIDHDNSIVFYSNGNTVGLLPSPSSGLYISRYSSSGTLTHQYQITQNDNFDSPLIGGLAIDKEGNFIVTGYYHVSLQIGTASFGTPGSQSSRPVQLFVAKFSATGAFNWAKVSEGLSTGGDVEVDDLGNIYLTGTAPGHATLGEGMQINSSEFYAAFIAKLNSHGHILWSKPIVGMTPTGLKRTDTGDLYISGTCYNIVSYDSHKLVRTKHEQSIVLKINSDTSLGGAIVSDGVPHGYTFKTAYNSSVDNAGNVYTIGNFHKRIVFGCDTLHSPGDDMFITKYTSLPPVYSLEIGGPAVLCTGTQLHLSATAVPEPVKYFWDLPSGVTATTQVSNQINTSVSANANGGDVSVGIRKGCYNYHSANPYKINMQFIPKAVVISGQQVYCSPDTVRFFNSLSANAAAYSWQLPVGIIPKQSSLVTANAFIDVIISNEFVEGLITAKARNECFESELSNALMVQLVKPPSPIAFLSTKDEYCNRGQTETIEIAKSERASEYVWKIPSIMKEAGTVSSLSSKIQITFMNAGLGVLSVYAKNGCHQTEEITYPITLINPLAEPKISISSCDLELSTDGTENIEWFKDTKKFGQGASTITLSEAGEYFVTVTNFCGTIASTSIAAKPLTDELVFIPNVITPNNDGLNDVLAFTTGLDALSLEIFDRWGKMVYRNTNYKNDWGSTFEPDLYFFQISHYCLKQQYKGWLQVIR